MTEGSHDERIADVARRVGGRFRVKLWDEPEPEAWAKWLIAPAVGYLETAGCGPWPAREVEWVEVEPVGSETSRVVAAFAAVGLPADVVDGNVRVVYPARYNNSSHRGI